MIQRTWQDLHVAIIMDGNGRWAAQRGLPRTAGHKVGADAVRRTIEAAARLGIGALTLYAFSSDNWKRPRREINALWRLFVQNLRAESTNCVENGIRLEVVGRRDRLPRMVVAAVAAAEARTARGTRLHLRLAVDYSARAAIQTGELLPDVDLLIRTGGEQRLSDFLLWESAYAELYFTDRLWPDFGPAELDAALDAFARRERRFGGVPQQRAVG